MPRGWGTAVLQQAPVLLVWAAILLVVGSRYWSVERGRRLCRWLVGLRPRPHVPSIDARALGLFRMVFAAGVAYVLEVHRLEPLAGPGDGLFAALASRPDALAAIRSVTLAAVALFAVGLWTRPALVVASLGTFLWMGVWTQQFGSHPVAILVVTMPALWPCRWGDGRSLDALRASRAAQAPAVPSARYGYGVWVPMLAFGLACLAAAWSKVAEGPAWIANGTVKFAFVADAHRAAVPWGLWIASHHWAAVAASAAAVGIEASVITAVFAPSRAYRLTIGALAALLFLGFWLFQGELWRAWWLLFLAFLPWDALSRALDRAVAAAGGRLSRATAAPPPPFDRSSRGLSPLQAAVALTLVAVQLVASAARLEVPPALSAYDMYSTTFASTAAFDAANPMLQYRFEVGDAQGGWWDVTECFDRPDSSQDAAGWGTDDERLARALSSCRIGSAPRVRLFESLKTFDWRSGRFGWKYRDREVWTVEVEGL